MTEETKENKVDYECCDSKHWKYKHHHGHTGGSGAVYFFGFVGALVYYLQQATNFQAGLIGFLKALAWPAFLIYKLLEVLKF